MEQSSPDYGAERRRMRIVKMRGVKYRGGSHDFVIRKGGLRVFPRLVAAEHGFDFASANTLSGVSQLDDLLGGGLPRGTSTLLIGPAGCGKSSVAIQYAAAAVKRGENASLFAFDEGLGTLFSRSKGIGTDLVPYVQKKNLTVQQIDPAELTPGEFTHLVRCEVEERNSKVVVIDSLNGYMAAMPEERFLILHLHELVSYLSQKGAITFMVVAQHGVLGASMTTPIDGSYLADSVILFRYFEVMGEVRRAISVMKKRSGPHENTIRELKIGPGGIEVGPPLKGFQGILSGTPRPVETV
jgi:circadian clock protein KaiC